MKVTVTRRQLLAAGAGGVALTMVGATARAVPPLAPALFVAAHPDDETLAMGVAIVEHIAAGQDVHMLWLTRGEASAVRRALNGERTAGWWGVLHNPASEGYSPLDAAAFGRARLAEGSTAASCLALGLPGTLTVHEGGLPDGAVTAAAARAAILDVADAIAPGAAVRVKTHSHVVDNHPDHVAAGAAARALRDTDPARFGDLRHYVLPAYWTDARLGTVGGGVWDLPGDAAISARARNACRAYGAWAPALGAYAIGYHSVAAYFALVDSRPRCLVHP